MTNKCIGCGATLQSTKPNDLGYIPSEKIKTAKYCERCFKINNYNLKTVTKLNNINDYILKEINTKAKYVYYLLDFLNINNETIDIFKQIKVNKTLVISKLDVIPKSIKLNSITNWLKETYGIEERVMYQSSIKNINTNEIINSIKGAKTKEVYITGFTNSGKSNLINTLINSDEKLTTSNNLNTTIDFVKIKLDDITLIDSPGFTYKNTIYKEDEFDLIKRTNPKKFLKPTTYQTKKDLTIQIEDKISIKTTNKNSLTTYMSNDINLNKVFDNEIKKQLDLPVMEIENNDNIDLVIKSLGFINIKKKDQLKIGIKEKDLIEIRPSLFK